MKTFYFKIISCICILQMIALFSFGQEQSKTFVLVHGAWGGSWSFKQTEVDLRKNGYDVYRPCLTGQGEKVHLATPDIDLNTHVLDVINSILYENLTNVILVGHSYGGMVITGVADSIPERISRMIYLDALAPNDGESLITARRNENVHYEEESENGFLIPKWVSEGSPLPKDVPQPLKTFTTPVSRKNKKALKIPATYILTVDNEQDKTSDPFFYFSERAKARGWKVIVMIADHNPQISNVPELTKLLIDETN